MQLVDFVPLQRSVDSILQNIALLRQSSVGGQQMMILAYTYTQHVRKIHHSAYKEAVDRTIYGSIIYG